MQKITKRLFLFIAIIGLLLTFVGCKKDNNDFVLNLKFDHIVYDLELNETINLTPVVEFGKLEDLTLEWTSYDENVVVVENGELTAVGFGKTTVKVACTDRPYIAATATVRVYENDLPRAKFELVGDVKFNEPLYPGDKCQLVYTFNHENPNAEIQFSSSNEAVATVDQEGNITPVAKGSTTIVAKVASVENESQFLEYEFSFIVREYNTITYNLDGGELPEDAVTSFRAEDGIIELPVPTKENCNFLGWFGNSILSGDPVETIDASSEHDFVFYAKFIEVTPGVADSIDESKTYKYGLFQGNKNQTLYLTGEYSGYYGATTENFYDAADVNLLAVEGGYNIKLTLADGTVKYLNIVPSGTHINIKFEDEATSIWSYNTAYNTYTTIVNEKEYYIGTYNSYNTFSPSTIDKASTSFVGHLYEEVVVTPEMKADMLMTELQVEERILEDYELQQNEYLEWSLKEESKYVELENGVLLITRPENGEGNAQVIVIATITVKDVVVTKEFTFVIPEQPEFKYEVATKFDTETTYKLGVNQENVGKLLFLTGEMNGYYGASTEDVEAAANIKVIEVEGGYKLQVTVGTEIVYLVLTQSGSYTNVGYVSESDFVWQYNEEFNTFTHTFGSTTYYAGMYKTFETLSPSNITYASKAGNFVMQLYKEKVKTYVAQYDKSQGTTNFDKENGGKSNATLLGLDDSLFTVTGTKAGSNMPGLNGSDGTLRLYAATSSQNANTATFEIASGTIKTIRFEFTQNAQNLVVLVNGEEVEAVEGIYTINAPSFTITNGATGQIRIKLIEIVA